MGKIVVSENVSLDGVMQDPTGEEGFERGGWFHRIGGRDREAWADVELAEALHAEALLLGRRSEAFFAARWASRSGEWADRLNTMPKYVVSSSLDIPAWSNSTVLGGVVVDEVRNLAQQLEGEIVVYASGQLVRTLMEHDLVDELRLMVHPVVVGAGQRLFDAHRRPLPLRLRHHRTVGVGLVLLTYEIIRGGHLGMDWRSR